MKSSRAVCVCVYIISNIYSFRPNFHTMPVVLRQYYLKRNAPQIPQHKPLDEMDSLAGKSCLCLSRHTCCILHEMCTFTLIFVFIGGSHVDNDQSRDFTGGLAKTPLHNMAETLLFPSHLGWVSYQYFAIWFPNLFSTNNFGWWSTVLYYIMVYYTLYYMVRFVSPEKSKNTKKLNQNHYYVTGHNFKYNFYNQF